MPELVAAGAVLWRRRSPGAAVEVAVVHRPRYDDWSWPKGKTHRGEPLPATAAREVAEETGHTAVLGPRLGSTCYPVAAGDKVAHYWAARAGDGTFRPSDEVDKLCWLPPAEATRLLSYPHDRALIADLDLATAVTGCVLLVRHAKAGRREEWQGDDTLRPLTAAGQQQAKALRALLPLFGPQRVHSAPLVRCRQTVEGLAADLGVPLLDEPLLAEENYPAAPGAALHRLREIAAGPGPAVVCSQGGVIPDLVKKLEVTRIETGERQAAETTGQYAAGTTLSVPEDPPSRKGGFWALFFGGEPPEPLSLLTADYYDDPLS